MESQSRLNEKAQSMMEEIRQEEQHRKEEHYSEGGSDSEAASDATLDFRASNPSPERNWQEAKVTDAMSFISRMAGTGGVGG